MNWKTVALRTAAAFGLLVLFAHIATQIVEGMSGTLANLFGVNLIQATAGAYAVEALATWSAAILFALKLVTSSYHLPNWRSRLDFLRHSATQFGVLWVAILWLVFSNRMFWLFAIYDDPSLYAQFTDYEAAARSNVHGLIGLWLSFLTQYMETHNFRRAACVTFGLTVMVVIAFWAAALTIPV
jgi:hypothetical protein